MKTLNTLLLIPLLAFPAASPGAEQEEEVVAKHQEGSLKVADDQDELAADVQQLVIEQTVPEVIELLNEARDIMDEATDLLIEHETGGVTIAAQTEIIEKIHAAAKERQKQQGGGQAGGAMMDMMERMMGKQPGDQAGEGDGEKPGDGGGQGQEGESDAANSAAGGSVSGGGETRKFENRASGVAGRTLPPEFQKALDAYNRGAETQPK